MQGKKLNRVAAIQQQFLPVKQNILVPLDYWKEGASVPAENCFQRWSRFNEYRALYDGDWRSIAALDFEIQVNHFKTVTDNWAELMLAYPPEISDEVLQADLHQAIETVVRDYFRFGVGWFYPFVDNDGQAHIEAVDPRLVFPSDDGDTLIRFHQDVYIDVITIPHDGPVTVNTHKLHGGTITTMIDPYHTILGPQISSEIFNGGEGRGIISCFTRRTLR